MRSPSREVTTRESRKQGDSETRCFRVAHSEMCSFPYSQYYGCPKPRSWAPRFIWKHIQYALAPKITRCEYPLLRGYHGVEVEVEISGHQKHGTRVTVLRCCTRRVNWEVSHMHSLMWGKGAYPVCTSAIGNIPKCIPHLGHPQNSRPETPS